MEVQRSSESDKHLERPGKSVVFLNRSYWPDQEATGQLLTSLCERLSVDWRVSVIAGQPNSISSSDANDKTWLNQEFRRGVSIHRVGHSRLSKGRMLSRALNYVTFAHSVRRMLRAIPAPDIVVFETDPFLLPFEAQRLQKRSGCRMVGYLQDIYPDVAIALKKIPNCWPVRKLREALFRVYRNCDQMIVLSRDMCSLLVEGGVRRDRITIVNNWADESLFNHAIDVRNRFRSEHDYEDKFLVMYSGNIGQSQRLEQFLYAAEQLSVDPVFQFAFVGRGSQLSALEAIVAARKIRNVRFFDYQPLSELADSLSAADLHLIPFSAELSRCLMPSKLYGILASGRPYLTNAASGCELHDLTVTHQTGLTVNAGSVTAIVEAIRNARRQGKELRQFGTNGLRLAAAEFTLERSASKIHHALRGTLAANSTE